MGAILIYNYNSRNLLGIIRIIVEIVIFLYNVVIALWAKREYPVFSQSIKVGKLIYTYAIAGLVLKLLSKFFSRLMS